MTPFFRLSSVLSRLKNSKLCARKSGGIFSSDINFSRAHCVHDIFINLFSGSFNEKYDDDNDNNNNNNNIVI